MRVIISCAHFTLFTSYLLSGEMFMWECNCCPLWATEVIYWSLGPGNSLSSEENAARGLKKSGISHLPVKEVPITCNPQNYKRYTQLMSKSWKRRIMRINGVNITEDCMCFVQGEKKSTSNGNRTFITVTSSFTPARNITLVSSGVWYVETCGDLWIKMYLYLSVVWCCDINGHNINSPTIFLSFKYSLPISAYPGGSGLEPSQDVTGREAGYTVYRSHVYHRPNTEDKQPFKLTCTPKAN